MKDVHILYYTAAILFALAALLAFVNGALVQGAVAILFAVGLYLFGASQRAKKDTNQEK